MAAAAAGGRFGVAPSEHDLTVRGRSVLSTRTACQHRSSEPVGTDHVGTNDKHATLQLPWDPPNREESMRAAMMSLALLAALVVPLDEAAGLTSCERKCHGNAGCLSACKSVQKPPAPAKRQQQAAPAPAGNSQSGGWRERAFTTEGGAGGY